MHEIKTRVASSQRGKFVGAAVVLGLTILTVVICALAPKPHAEGEAGVVMDGLPGEIGPLESFPAEVTDAERLILPKDTGFARSYYGRFGSFESERIFCSIVLSGAERRSIHRPERCLPGQGWRIDSSHVESVPLDSGRTLQVTALMLERRDPLQDGTFLTRHQYFLYWFVGKGRDHGVANRPHPADVLGHACAPRQSALGLRHRGQGNRHRFFARWRDSPADA